MNLKPFAAVLLSASMMVAPAFAQSTTAPAGIGTSPNGNVMTSTGGGSGANSTNAIVPAARGTIGGPSVTTTTGQSPSLALPPNARGTVGSPTSTTMSGGMAMPAGRTAMPGTAAPMAATGAAMPAMSMTNINTASASDLDKLPQIGKSRAAKIIKMRPYTSTDDLVTKKVLPMSVYNKIKTQITAS